MDVARWAALFDGNTWPTQLFPIAQIFSQAETTSCTSTGDSIYFPVEGKGVIKAEWGVSDNNRRAKYYELTFSGKQQLEVETDAWQKLTAAVTQVLESV